MQAGYYQPLTSQFRLAWMWWVILVSIQQVLYYENNLRYNFIDLVLLALAVVFLYFLVRQRRFLISHGHLYMTRDFRLGMLDIDLAYVEDVKISKNIISFIYIGKEYHYFVMGKSKRLLRELLMGTIPSEPTETPAQNK